MKQVNVGLEDNGYPILIKQSLLAEIGPELKHRNIGNKFIIISDEYVANLYAQDLIASCQGAGLDIHLLTFPRGEESKKLATIETLCRQLAQLGVDRQAVLLALGGGVTGDITGFIAAIYMRGIKFVQVPTSLLAQVDSSVGGKTGVDIPEGKNLIGSFYQPQAVFVDTNVLQSLPAEEFRNGLAEVIKYGVIYDADFFNFLATNREAILAMDFPVVEAVIARCCTIKAEVVMADEKEADLRRILNYGHTLGHAVEAASDFNIAHGVAVGLGMVAANKLAVSHGILAPERAERIQSVIEDFGLPSQIPAHLNRQRMVDYLQTDKKSVDGKPFFILPSQIGKVIITNEVEPDIITMALA